MVVPTGQAMGTEGQMVGSNPAASGATLQAVAAALRGPPRTWVLAFVPRTILSSVSELRPEVGRRSQAVGGECPLHIPSLPQGPGTVQQAAS